MCTCVYMCVHVCTYVIVVAMVFLVDLPVFFFSTLSISCG